MSTFRRAALVALIVLALGACGDKETKPITQSDLVNRLKDSGNLSEPFATCVADKIYPGLSDADKKALAKDDADNQAQQTALLDKSAAAGTACTQEGVSPKA